MEVASVSTKSPSILLVEDEELVLQVTEMILSDLGFDVHIASTGAEAVQQIEAHNGNFDLVLIDHRLPDDDGLSVIKHVRSRFSDLRFMVVTGYASDDMLQSADKYGVCCVLNKPYNVSELTRAVDNALQNRRIVP